jgi:hypothetical protein
VQAKRNVDHCKHQSVPREFLTPLLPAKPLWTAAPIPVKTCRVLNRSRSPFFRCRLDTCSTLLPSRLQNLNATRSSGPTRSCPPSASRTFSQSRCSVRCPPYDTGSSQPTSGKCTGVSPSSTARRRCRICSRPRCFGSRRPSETLAWRARTRPSSTSTVT